MHLPLISKPPSLWVLIYIPLPTMISLADRVVATVVKAIKATGVKFVVGS